MEHVNMLLHDSNSLPEKLKSEIVQSCAIIAHEPPRLRSSLLLICAALDKVHAQLSKVNIQQLRDSNLQANLAALGLTIDSEIDDTNSPANTSPPQSGPNENAGSCGLSRSLHTLASDWNVCFQVMLEGAVKQQLNDDVWRTVWLRLDRRHILNSYPQKLMHAQRSAEGYLSGCVATIPMKPVPKQVNVLCLVLTGTFFYYLFFL
jgi:hypothetical protein